MSTDASDNNDMEEMARKRKERLEALKKLAAGEQTETTDKPLPGPVFRNYNPTDESLKELKKPKTVPTAVEEIFSDELQSAEADLSQTEEVDLTSLSKKIDMDLKRIIAKPLQKLERRTQRAIAELIRERISSDLRSDGTSTSTD